VSAQIDSDCELVNAQRGIPATKHFPGALGLGNINIMVPRKRVLLKWKRFKRLKRYFVVLVKT
jgi:hypothetical protein